MIKVVYEVEDSREIKRKVDYIPVDDIPYAYDVFMSNHGLSRPRVLGLIRIDDAVYRPM